MTNQGSVRAFVPGHATAFFSPHWTGTPEETGATGAGVTLTTGVTVELEGAEEVEVILNGSPISLPPVMGLLDVLSVSARVKVDTELPVGAGFGVSGAVTLGTALVANYIWDLGLSENALTTVAHCAEVEAGTGLGDVTAQIHGGIPIRLEPGAPEYCVLDGIPSTGRLEYISFGEIDTNEVLSTQSGTLKSAGDEALTKLQDEPTIERLFAVAGEFAETTGLLTPRVQRVIEDVESGGGEGMMAMIGETVIARGTGLSDAGYESTVSEIHPRGAFLRRV